jgi:AMMECR1 domain-containing protein
MAELSIQNPVDASADKSLGWSPAHAQAVVSLARELLRCHFGFESAQSRADELPNIPFTKLNVTVRARGKLRGSMSASGFDIGVVLALAVERAVNDKRFGGPLLAGEVEHTILEIWIQFDCEYLMSPSIELIREKMELGLHGLEVRCGDKQAYFKPSVPLTSHFRSHEEVLSRLCKKAGLALDSWKVIPMTIGVTHWVHAVEQMERPASACICRGFRVSRAVCREAVRTACEAAALRLLRSQRADGAYCYKYHPFTDQEDDSGFNLVRMAGSAYAMCAIAAEKGIRGSAAFESSAYRAIDFLMLRAQPTTNGGIFISEIGVPCEGKLGTAALLARALQYGSFAQRRLEDRKRLLGGLLEMQNEAGLLGGVSNKPEDLETGQDYFPGEALSALALEQEPSIQGKCREALRRAFAPYRQRFRERPASGFILWQIEAWAGSWKSLVKEDPQVASQYADFVFELADWILPFQYETQHTPYADYVGGFSRPNPPTFSSAVFTEAIIHAYSLASALGLAVRIERYRAAALAGLNFILKLQIPSELSGVFPRPELAIGGFTEGMNSFLIRNDFDQHFITAALAALRAPSVFE